MAGGALPGVAQTAVALITAHVDRLPNEVFAEILAEADPGEVALFLAALVAERFAALPETGEELARYGLAAARGVA